MNKVELLKRLISGSRSNLFSLEIPTTKADEKQILVWIKELEIEKKIKIREYVQREYSVFLHGIIKYASE